jgi:drug/metabolite transporter (DMT)-like permease
MPENAEKNKLIAPALLVGVIAVSFASVFFRLAAPTHPLVMAGIRLGIAAALLSPFLIRAAIQGKTSSRFVIHALLAGVFYGIHFGAWVTSLTLTSVAASVTLVTINPIFLSIVGLVTGKDKPGKGIFISLLLAVIGLAVIGGEHLALGGEAITGDLLALVGSLAMSGYLLVGRRLGEDFDVFLFSGLATGTGAILLLGTALFLGIPIEAASPIALFFLILTALIPQLIGHNILTWALKHAKPVTVSMAIIGEPVGAAVLSLFILSEAMSAQTIIGCSLTLAGVIWAIKSR